MSEQLKSAEVEQKSLILSVLVPIAKKLKHLSGFVAVSKKKAVSTIFECRVSGCPNCCADSNTRDIGLVGGAKGWKILVGGKGGRKPGQIKDSYLLVAIWLLTSEKRNFCKL